MSEHFNGSFVLFSPLLAFMMEIDPKTYPSRIFIRFTAHQQLLADATDQPITVMMQRLGKEPLLQKISPGGDPPFFVTEPGNGEKGLNLGILMGSMQVKPSSEPTQEDTPTLAAPGGTVPASDETEGLDSAIDESLFAEIVKTMFKPENNPELYQSCGTAKAAEAVELRVIAEIVSTYRQIKQKQDCPIVQGLNKLL